MRIRTGLPKSRSTAGAPTTTLVLRSAVRSRSSLKSTRSFERQRCAHHANKTRNRSGESRNRAPTSRRPPATSNLPDRSARFSASTTRANIGCANRTTTLPRAKVGGVDDPAVRWAGAFAAYGGHGTTASSNTVHEIEPGGRLGWHTDATEETQYILAGTGELRLEDGTKHKVGPGSVFVLPTPMRHDLANTGKETLRAVAFFAAA